MEHDDFSSDISSDDCEHSDDSYHEHEQTVEYIRSELIAFEIFKMVQTNPHSNYAKNQIRQLKIFQNFL